MTTARDRLAAALPIGSIDDRDMADAILAADPTLAEAIELGLAFREAEEALAEKEAGGEWDRGIRFTRSEYGCHAFGGDVIYSAGYPTPTAALQALAAALRERKEAK